MKEWNYEELPERQEIGTSDRVSVAVEGCPYLQTGYYDYDLNGWFTDCCNSPVNVYTWKDIKLPEIN